METLGIGERVWRHAQGRIRIYPQHTNRASNAGHPCERFLVLVRREWRQRIPHDAGLQLVFDDGNLHERAVLRKLDDVGIEVVEQQRDYMWDEYQLSGHIDGKVLHEGQLIPIEIKSMSPHAFQRFTTAEDVVAAMLDGPIYHRLYPAQLLLYMRMDGKDRAAWIFKNKLNGRIEDRVIHLEPYQEYVGQVLARLDRVNEHVRAHTMPDIEVGFWTCEGCGFHHVCHPDRIDGRQVEMVPELEWYLDLREKLQLQIRPIQAELREVEQEIALRVGRFDSMVIAGHWRGVPRVVQSRGRNGDERSYTTWKWSRVDE